MRMEYQENLVISAFGSKDQLKRQPARIRIWIIWSVLTAVFLIGCAAKYTRPLVTRGLPAEERKDYIVQNGFGIPENIKNAFLEGYPIEGMGRELVYQMFGAPDRTGDRENIWEYVDGKGKVIVGITFKNDKIEKIVGDPQGGTAPITNTSENEGNAGKPTNSGL